MQSSFYSPVKTSIIFNLSKTFSINLSSNLYISINYQSIAYIHCLITINIPIFRSIAKTAIPYNKDKSKTSCLHVPAYVFQRSFLCDFVGENSFEKNVPTTFWI